jgi:GDPmannose 4,6-dehydratase
MDGSYLAELLLEKGYSVWGVIRRNSATENTVRIQHIINKINVRYGDMTDKASLYKIVGECEPDEIYNLAAMSHVGLSFKMPEYTFDVDAKGVLNILEVMKDVVPKSRFYQASTSELFGITKAPQNELSPFHPRSPYGVAKLAAYWSVVNYRESYGMFCSNGILFNHEGLRRGGNFVTKKITKSVARIKLGKQSHVELGNLDAERDWGYAKCYVEAMWLMLQHDKADDFIVATGKSYKVRDFLKFSFDAVGIDIKTNGKKGIDEEWYNADTDELVVKINPEFYRPAEVFNLRGDYSKAKKELGWEPKVGLDELVSRMVNYDLENSDEHFVE